MRGTLCLLLAALAVAGAALATEAPVIDGVLTPGEWDDFFLETIYTEWPDGCGSGSFHMTVDVYLAQDRDNFYIAYDGYPDEQAYAVNCDRGAEASHYIQVCGSGVPPTQAGCNDSYNFCADPGTHFMLLMGGDRTHLIQNAGVDCDAYPNFGWSDPVPAADYGIVSGYYGALEACRDGVLNYRTELMIPRSVLGNPPEIRVGGFQWQGELAFVFEDPCTLEPYDCTCRPGKSLVIPVTIDIKPGSSKNCVNLGSEGQIKVAVLATDDFDPVGNGTGLYCESLLFLGANADRCRTSDVNGDGRMDLLALYRGRKILNGGGYLESCETGVATLTGLTFGGDEIEGQDRICFLGGVCP